jgi:hypothetical protein
MSCSRAAHIMSYDKGMLDAAVGGSLINKEIVYDFKLIDDMSLNQSRRHNLSKTLIVL